MPNDGQWTDGRFRAFILSVLRSGSRRWPPKWRTLLEAQTEKKINPKTKRLAQFYRCNVCKKEFPKKDIEVDHIKPIIPKEGFTSWDSVINNMYCDGTNLQAICIGCHKKKTKKERAK